MLCQHNFLLIRKYLKCVKIFNTCLNHKVRYSLKKDDVTSY